MTPPVTLTTIRSSPSAKPSRISAPCARAGSNMVLNDCMMETALIGRVGSCWGERAAQRPSTMKTGSIS